MSRVVLVTGVAGVIGGLVARGFCADKAVTRVIGVDSVPPLHHLGRATFVRADIRGPVIAKVLAQEKVDTVVHVGVLSGRRIGGRSSQKEVNVIGTMQLLAACQRARDVRRLVVRSSSAVYGSSPRDPAMFTEEMTARRAPLGPIGKDSADIESYVRGFARRSPDVQVCTLRLSPVLGGGLHSPLADYFALPAVPVPIGFDGRFQVIGLDDAVRAFRLAADSDVTGAVNVAGDGVLTIRQASRIARTPVVPVLAQTAGLVQQAAKMLGLGTFDAEQMDFLCYGRGLDTTRMRRDLRLRPQASTREVFAAQFGQQHEQKEEAHA